MDSTVMKTLSGATTGKLKNEADLSKSTPSSYTATFSGINHVYNLFPGKVLFLGYYKGMGTITVQVSQFEILRYCNLKEITVWYGDEITEGFELGVTYPHKDFQLEYCTGAPDTSKFPVRINDKTYYKQNPMKILNGLYIPEQATVQQGWITVASDTLTFTEDELKEWGRPTMDNSTVIIDGATF